MSTFVARQLQQPTRVLCARLGPDRGRQLVSYGGEDGVVRVYPFASSSPVAQLCGLQGGGVTAIAYDSNERTIIAGSGDGDLCAWELSTERVMRQALERRPKAAVSGIAVHKSDTHVATIAMDGVLRLWDLRKRVPHTQVYREAQGGPLLSLALSPCGRWAATGAASGAVRLYDLSANLLMQEWQMSTSHNNNNSNSGGGVSALRFHPEMPLLAACTRAGEVAVWNARTQECAMHDRPTNASLDAVCFCGTRLVFCAERAAHSYALHANSHVSNNHSSYNTNTFTADRGKSSMSSKAQSVFVPWLRVADIVYSSYVEEMWYCAFAAETATTGVLPLRDCCGTAGTHSEENEEEDAARHGEAAHGHTNHTPRARSVLSDVVEDTAVPSSATAVAPPSRTPSEPTSTTELCVPGEAGTGPELQLIDALVRGSTAVTNVLQWRLKQLRAARASWASDPCAAVDYLVTLDGAREENVLLDFFAMLQRQCLAVPPRAVPRVLELVCSALDDAQVALQLSALRTLRLMKDILAQQHQSGTEEAQRTAYAMSLERLQQSCEPRLRQLARHSDHVGSEARAMLDELVAAAMLTDSSATS